MEFHKLPSNTRALLSEIVSSDNPSDLLCNKFKNASSQQDDELRGMLRELKEYGYLKIFWADNMPYYITINNSARTYEEQLAEYEIEKQTTRATNITIGSNNKIKNSTIAGSISKDGLNEKKGFYEKHPVVCGFLISLAAGILLLFSFWSHIVSFIEGMF